MAVTGLRGARAQSPPPEQPSSSSTLLRSLRLSLASGYYSMVQALGLKRLNAMLQVATLHDHAHDAATFLHRVGIYVHCRALAILYGSLGSATYWQARRTTRLVVSARMTARKAC